MPRLLCACFGSQLNEVKKTPAPSCSWKLASARRTRITPRDRWRCMLSRQLRPMSMWLLRLRRATTEWADIGIRIDRDMCGVRVTGRVRRMRCVLGGAVLAGRGLLLRVLAAVR